MIFEQNVADFPNKLKQLIFRTKCSPTSEFSRWNTIFQKRPQRLESVIGKFGGP